jgi:hypothetical protein
VALRQARLSNHVTESGQYSVGDQFSFLCKTERRQNSQSQRHIETWKTNYGTGYSDVLPGDYLPAVLQGCPRTYVENTSSCMIVQVPCIQYGVRSTYQTMPVTTRCGKFVKTWISYRSCCLHINHPKPRCVNSSFRSSDAVVKLCATSTAFDLMHNAMKIQDDQLIQNLLLFVPRIRFGCFMFALSFLSWICSQQTIFPLRQKSL